MGILYEAIGPIGWGVAAFVLLGLMAFNELGRTTKWGGIVLFVITPVILTIFVWPKTAAFGNEYGTGYWFTWVKTYSALAGTVGFMLIRYIPSLAKKKGALIFPPLILAINIFEAVLRDFQLYSYHLWNGGMVENLWVMSGPWNIMNGIAGILNIITISGWYGIFVSKDRTKDMIWPDMIWPWIIAYDLWNYAYTYNAFPDRSFYSGLLLLLSCTIPAFFTKKGAWLQHRASTLSLWAMFVMTAPQVPMRIFPVRSTHNPKAFFAVSFAALVANVAVAIYHFYRIRKYNLNPLKDEIYKGTKAYQKAVEENM